MTYSSVIGLSSSISFRISKNKHLVCERDTFCSRNILSISFFAYPLSSPKHSFHSSKRGVKLLYTQQQKRYSSHPTGF